MKKEAFELDGRQIEGFGFFDPRRIPSEYTAFFQRLEMLQGIFDSPDIPPEVTPEAFISQIAKKEAKYFAEVQNRDCIKISTDAAAVSRRQKLMGTVFAYHSGTWNAGECYRNYEIWRLTDRSLRFYQKIHTADTAFRRGKALMSLINTTAQRGVAIHWIP